MIVRQGQKVKRRRHALQTVVEKRLAWTSRFHGSPPPIDSARSMVYSSNVRGVLTTRFVARALGVLIVALVSATPRVGASSFECARIVALGDLHGGVDSIHTILEATQITDRHRQWTSSDACLVIVGDMVDRGDRSRELLDYVISLGKQAPGQVHVTLGNHEVMNLIGDLRYVTPGEFGAYSDLETKKQRQRGRLAGLRRRR